MVITIAITAVLATMVSIFIERPIFAYVSMARRAELVDAADQALRRLARDIQRSVPNSIRLSTSGSTVALEMINVVEGVRYRVNASPGSTQPYLDFTKLMTTFDLVQPFQFTLNNTTCQSNACRVVIYNTGATTNGSSNSPAPGANVYSTSAAPACSTPGTTSCNPPPGSVVITPPTTTVTLSNSGQGGEGNVLFGTGVQFAFASPQQRLYVVDTPISYICSPSSTGGSLTRYQGYAINSTQPTSAPTGSSSALLTNDVTGCSLTYQAGTSMRNASIMMTLTLSKATDTITLMRLIEVSNQP
jgi:MSHA biogenesis protein MshO